MYIIYIYEKTNIYLNINKTYIFYVYINIYIYEGRVLYHMCKPSVQSDPSIKSPDPIAPPVTAIFSHLRAHASRGGQVYLPDTPRNLTATLW